MRRAALIAIALACGCNGNCTGWNTAFERMVEQPKYRSYAPSELYPDGRAMRAPPDGTVSFDEELEPVDLTRGGAPDKPVDHFPLPLTDDLLTRGQNRFDIFCAPCHGVSGDGDSAVSRKMTLRHPPSLGEERLRALNPGQLYRVVQLGYGLMPSYQNQLLSLIHI